MAKIILIKKEHTRKSWGNAIGWDTKN